MTKYRAIRTTIGDLTFDSKGEARRYEVLKAREAAGLISDLSTQASYSLTVNGVKVATYRADFTYRQDGEAIVEDYKSPATVTPIFKLKCKLMRACHDIDVKVVMKADAD